MHGGVISTGATDVHVQNNKASTKHSAVVHKIQTKHHILCEPHDKFKL